MKRLVLSACVACLLILGAAPTVTHSQDSQSATSLKPVDIGPTGIAIKKPVFAGACKACPWGVLAEVTQAAMKPYGYDVKVCWVCWSNFGPREMADKTKPVIPRGADQYPTALYVEPPPDDVPDISATSETNLIDAWNGTGAYASDHKQRRNYRIVAVVQQPNFLIMAATKKSGITDLSQIKDRQQPTWIVGQNDTIFKYYGIDVNALKAKGGGIISSQDREKRASADVFIGGALLVDTPEQRMWYEVSQLDDLVYFDFPEQLINQLNGQGGYTPGTAPIALLRGLDRPISTLMRSAHVIYVRDDAPDSFTYAVAKALDQHQELFRMYGDPWYYDTRLVADSKVIPMAPGAMRYYRERGYVKK